MPHLLESAATAPALYRSPRDKIFFPNLNGLRFLAALLVVIDHIEGTRFDLGLFSHWNNPAMALLGQLGVTLFFALSGFLITYLLLAEKEKLGTVKFQDFYLRRALRIWPLYYVLVGLGLLVLPALPFFNIPELSALAQEHLGLKLGLYVLILPNVVKELFRAVPYLSPAWSIGVEEQFYLFWPVVIRYTRRYVPVIAGIGALVTVSSLALGYLSAPGREIIPNTPLVAFLKNFLFFFRIQCMCIGGLFAVALYFRWDAVLRPLMARPTQVITWLLAVVLVARGQEFWHLTHEVYAVLFGTIILNLAAAHNSIFNFQQPWLDYLGRISYGLYMLHSIAIVVGIRLVSLLVADSASWLHQAGVYALSLGLAVGLAAASYHYLEKPFLRLKKHFVHVQSGS
jgi:peptidoglycan/LPS O-acetylase OafA/YrhL